MLTPLGAALFVIVTYLVCKKVIDFIVDKLF
jgi:hypothetical protein